MHILRTLKSLLAIISGGALFAALIMLIAFVMLVLFVIPGGLGIWSIESDRFNRWLRRAFGLFAGRTIISV